MFRTCGGFIFEARIGCANTLGVLYLKDLDISKRDITKVEVNTNSMSKFKRNLDINN